MRVRICVVLWASSTAQAPILSIRGSPPALESELNDVPGRDFVTRTSLCPIVSWSQVTWDIACQSVALQSALFDTVATLMYAFSIGIVRKLARLFVPKPGNSQVFM